MNAIEMWAWYNVMNAFDLSTPIEGNIVNFYKTVVLCAGGRGRRLWCRIYAT